MNPWKMTRRRWLGAGTAFMAAMGLGWRPAKATSTTLEAALKNAIGARRPAPGRVVLDLPKITENGASVLVGVQVNSPMTEADHVKAVHLFAQDNPNVEVITFHLTPRMGKVDIVTRIRLAQSQSVVAVAEMSDGGVYMDSKFTKVTIGGCGGGN